MLNQTNKANFVFKIRKQNSDRIGPRPPRTCALLSNLVHWPPQEAAQFAEENGCVFFETSAKTGENVKEIVLAIGTLCCVLHDLSKEGLPALFGMHVFCG